MKENIKKIVNLTPETYEVPKGEERFYHCIVEIRKFDQNTGERLSVPRVQKFGQKIFDRVVYDQLLKMGYTVTILHNPKEWIEKHQAEQAERAKAAQEAKAKAEQEKFDAAVAAAVAKALAEQKAQQEQTVKAETEQAEPAKKPGRTVKEKE